MAPQYELKGPSEEIVGDIRNVLTRFNTGTTWHSNGAKSIMELIQSIEKHGLIHRGGGTYAIQYQRLWWNAGIGRKRWAYTLWYFDQVLFPWRDYVIGAVVEPDYNQLEDSPATQLAQQLRKVAHELRIFNELTARLSGEDLDSLAEKLREQP